MDSFGACTLTLRVSPPQQRFVAAQPKFRRWSVGIVQWGRAVSLAGCYPLLWCGGEGAAWGSSLFCIPKHRHRISSKLHALNELHQEFMNLGW